MTRGSKAIGEVPVSGEPSSALFGCAVNVQFCSAPPLVLDVAPKQYFTVVDAPIGFTVVDSVADVLVRPLTDGLVMIAEYAEPASGQLAPSLGSVTPAVDPSIRAVPLPSGLICGDAWPI